MNVRTWVLIAAIAMGRGAMAQRRPPEVRGNKPAMRVTAVHLNVAGPFQNYQGACPVRVTFQGNISTNGAGEVPYTFEASDGHGYTGHRLEFSGPGTKPVNEVWELNHDFSGWLVLKPTGPFEYIRSARAPFRVKCTGHLRR